MIVSPSSTPGGPPLIALSARECDVVRLLTHGKTPAEIADALHLTEKTVRQYLLLLARGAGVKGMRQLTIWAYQNPGVTAGRPARAALHAAGCACGSPACVPWQAPIAA